MKAILVLSICAVIACPVRGETDALPKPSGKYHVGVTYLSFTDVSRKELFDDSGESNRDITVKAWYPSDNESDPEPYMLEKESEIAVKYMQFPETYIGLISNSCRDVPVSSGDDAYPVLIFSHGFGEHYSQNTILMEELASHGYIVFSIAHHFECKFSSYPDGRLIYIDMANLRFQKIMLEQQNPKAMELLQRTHAAVSDEERKKVLQETSETLPLLLTESPEYWAEDITFFIDQLEGINDGDGIFKGKLDTGRVGVFGMSLGGLATNAVCLADKRVMAGISIDGGLYGTLLEGRPEVPFMYLNSKRFLGYGNIFTGSSNAECYSFSVRGSEHYNFSDYSIYPVPSIGFLLGTIDGSKTIEIMNVIVPAFFDKYLKNDADVDLIKRAKRYPEIEIIANIR